MDPGEPVSVFPSFDKIPSLLLLLPDFTSFNQIPGHFLILEIQLGHQLSANHCFKIETVLVTVLVPERRHYISYKTWIIKGQALECLGLRLLERS